MFVVQLALGAQPLDRAPTARLPAPDGRRRAVVIGARHQRRVGLLSMQSNFLKISPPVGTAHFGFPSRKQLAPKCANQWRAPPGFRQARSGSARPQWPSCRPARVERTRRCWPTVASSICGQRGGGLQFGELIIAKQRARRFTIRWPPIATICTFAGQATIVVSALCYSLVSRKFVATGHWRARLNVAAATTATRLFQLANTQLADSTTAAPFAMDTKKGAAVASLKRPAEN